MYVKGIDVSNHQGKIDWKKVKEDGVVFASIKVTEGRTFVDKSADRNIEGAISNDILVSPYAFCRPDNNEPEAEVTHLMSTLHGFGLTYPNSLLLPIAPDLEHDSKLTSPKLAAWICKWMYECRLAAGHHPILYSYQWFLKNNLSAEYLTGYDLWIAHYTADKQPSLKGLPWKNWTFWQHSSRGEVDGITTRVDLDWFNGTYEELLQRIPSRSGLIAQ